MGKYRTKGSIALIITGSILILVLAGLYLGRNGILCRTADKRILYAEQKYGLSICYEDLRMKGLNEIELKNLSIVPRNRDTRLSVISSRWMHPAYFEHAPQLLEIDSGKN